LAVDFFTAFLGDAFADAALPRRAVGAASVSSTSSTSSTTFFALENYETNILT
jgi:hypothetical protein